MRVIKIQKVGRKFTKLVRILNEDKIDFNINIKRDKTTKRLYEYSAENF